MQLPEELLAPPARYKGRGWRDAPPMRLYVAMTARADTVYLIYTRTPSDSAPWMKKRVGLARRTDLAKEIERRLEKPATPEP
jgi:hypothetical protein